MMLGSEGQLMSFKNVEIEKKANIYFEGKVTSRKIIFADGSYKTLGIMLPGDYEFGTDLKEEMVITAGKLRYQLLGEDWQTIDGEGVFYVPANSRFKLEVETVTDYSCSYIAE